MAQKKGRYLGIGLNNIPYINLRLEFNALLALFREKRFRDQFLGHRGKQVPIKTHFFTWHGRPEVLLTYLLRDAIVSIECAVGGGVYAEALERSIMTKELLAAIKNPFKLVNGGTADCVFNGLPAQIDPKLSLAAMSAPLWEETKRFYREIRNPIFHNYEISEPNPDPILQALEFIWKLFEWLNSWNPVDRMVSGPIRMTEPDSLRTIPKPQPYSMMALIPERELAPDSFGVLQSDDFVQLPGIEDIEGMCIGSEEFVEFTMQTHEGKDANIRLSAHAAMKMLACLSIAHQQRGWEVPDRPF
jgi:hypothetical protein